LTPKTKEQNEAIRTQTRAAILQAGLELFAKKGYASTSISAIAKHANVSKGLMYNYFDSKEHLLKAIILEAIGVGDDFLHLIEGSFTLIQANFDYWKLMAALSFQIENIKGLEEVHQNTQAKIEMAAALFSELGYEKPRIEAIGLGAFMDGVMVHLIHMDDYPVEDIKNLIFKKYNL